MAEEESGPELEGFRKQLESLSDHNSGEEHALQSKSYCARFCKLVEEYSGRWQVPLPQLHVLHNALCSFAYASARFPSDCEHVHYTLSSLALSVFELLLFVGQSDFTQDPLKGILDSFQICYSSSLGKYQNVHLLQVGQIIREGGPWASPVLQAILKDSQLSCDEVDRYIGSEVPVFFELRVRYLLAGDRISEAVTLAKCCSQHPSAGRHLFFLQAYLTCLWKASHCQHVHTEMAEIDGKDAVDLICNMECEEKDELLLALSRAFLSQQLHRGDMYYLWNLVFIWSKLHLRVNPSKQDLLEHSRQLMLAATNIKSIFPFMRVILAELGKEGLQFCVELCTHALQTDLHCDAVTKSLIYKTIAYLLPNDLEVCRACALLVFFLERTVEAYKTVFLHYTHPDQEYHAEASPVGNHVRFEILQVLKKGLYFDPEFWNLITLRTNCLKLMSEKVVSAALVEIMEEDKWVVPNYCSAKEPCRWSADTTARRKTTLTHQTGASAAPKKRLHKDEKNHVTVTAKRVKARPADKTVEASSVGLPGKRRGRKPGGGAGGARPVKETGNSSLRRSFRQLDMAQENLSRQLSNRHMMTRLSEKKPPKRKIRKPRWLLLESAGQAENSAPRKGRKPGRKPQQQRTSAETKQPAASAAVKNNTKQKTAVTSSHLAVRDHEAKRRKELPTNCLSAPAPAPDAVLEVSQPENELTGAFSENSSSRQRAVDTQKLSPAPCEKQSPIQSLPAKDKLRDEVVLRVRDESFLIQQLHNYARRPEVQDVVLDPQTLGSTQTVVTLSSDQGELSEHPSGESCEKSVVEIEVTSQMQSATEMASSAQDVVEPMDVTKTEESPSGRDGQQTHIPLTPSENGVIPSDADSSTKGSTVHRETFSAEGIERLKVTVACELTNVLRESTDSIVSIVPKELTDREISNVPMKPIPTEDTAVSNEPSDMDIRTEPVPTKEGVVQKEFTDEGETSVKEPVSNKDVVVQREPTDKEVNIDLVEKAVPTTDTVIQKEPIEGETNVQVEPLTSNSCDVMDREATDVRTESSHTEDIEAHNEATTGDTNTHCVSGKETPVLESVSVITSDVAFTSNGVQEDISCFPDIDGEGQQGEVPQEIAYDASLETMATTPTTPADNARETTPTSPAENTMETTPTSPAENTMETTPPTLADNTMETTPTTLAENTVETTPPTLAENTVETTPTTPAENTVETTSTTPAENTVETTPTTPAENTVETTPTTLAENTMETTPTTLAENTMETTPPTLAENTMETTPTTLAENTMETTPTTLAENTVETTSTTPAENTVETTPTTLAENTIETTPTTLADNTMETTPAENTVETTPTTPAENTVETTSTTLAENTMETTPTTLAENTVETTPTTPAENTVETTPTTLAENTMETTPTTLAENTVETTPTTLAENTVETTPITPAENTVETTPTTLAENTMETTPTTLAENTVETTPTTPAENTMETTPTTLAENTMETTPTTLAENTMETTPTTLAENTVETTPTTLAENTVETTPITPAENTVETTPTTLAENTVETTPTTPAENTVETTPTTLAENTVETTPTTPAENTVETTPTTPAENTVETTPKIAAGNPKVTIPKTPVDSTTASTPTIPAGNPKDTPQGATDLMYRCSLCSKVFTGKRVSTHAMYHYRRDQCMFCGMLFKNDLLAMMHISEHMEMWKKGKMSVDGEVPESEQSGQSALRRGSRNRTAVNDAGSTPCDRRKLWSRNDNPLETPQSAEKKVSKSCDDKQAVQRLNGHLRRKPGRSKGRQRDSLLEGRETEASRQQLEDLSMEITTEEPETVGEKEQPCSSAEKMKENTHSSSLALDKVKQADGLSSSENIVRVTDTRCPLRHSLLNHALTCHHGDPNHLEAVFHLRNGKCCICTRKFRCFLHYRDHVDSHRESPKHPCLHRGCGERFNTRMEMRRHARRRHQPLQAECCFSECPKLFACFWALVLHEREHYPLPEEGNDGASVSALPTRTVKRTKRLQVKNKLKKIRVTKKQCREKDVSAAAPLTKNGKVNKMLTRRLKVTDKKKQVMRKQGVSKEKEALSAPPASTPTTFITKEAKKLKLKKKLRKTQIKKKLCVSTDKDPPLPAPPNTPMTTKMTKKVKVTDDLKKTQAVKKRCVSKDPLCQKAPRKRVKSKPNVSDGQVIKIKEVVTQAASITNTTTPVNMTLNETKVLKKRCVPEDKDALPPAPPKTPTTTKVNEEVKVTDDLKKTQAVTQQCVSEDPPCQKVPGMPVKSKPNVSDAQVTKVKEVVTSLVCGVKEEAKPLTETTYPTLGSSCDQKLVNGHTETTTELPKSLITVAKNTERKTRKTPQPATTPKAIKKKDEKDTNYGMMTKKPYVRPPPTAYLEERFITMPKRRKEMSWSPHRAPARFPPLQSPAGTATSQRQRCTNCFTSFKSAEDLQTHLSIKKCTNLFGIDSDEESNW